MAQTLRARNPGSTLRNAPTADRMEAMTNDDGSCLR